MLDLDFGDDFTVSLKFTFAPITDLSNLYDALKLCEKYLLKCIILIATNSETASVL